MAWIKFDKDLVNDPRVLEAAEGLAERYSLSVERIKGPGFSTGSDLQDSERVAMMRNAVIGALVTLWVYADTHITDGDVLKISLSSIDRMVGIEGFCSLLGPDWVQETNFGTWSVLPGYCEKNGLLSKEKRREANAERQRRFRERHSSASNAVTSNDVTPLDLDQDLDLKKKKNIVGQRPDLKPQALEVLNFLNSKTGRQYKPKPGTLEPILARLREGSTVDDLRAVVAKKCRDWSGDPKMNEYLRPKTLFNRANYANYEGELAHADSVS